MKKKIKGIRNHMGKNYWSCKVNSYGHAIYKITEKKNGDIKIENTEKLFIIKERYVEKIEYYV